MTPGPVKKRTSNSAPADNESLCRVKCVLVGDGAVGKTSLIIGYTTNGYPKEYRPTAYDKYSVVVYVNNKPMRLQICDTAGQDDFDLLRPLVYPRTDIFLICFSVVSPSSLDNVIEKWTREVRRHHPRTPMLLVGTQSDLRTDLDTLIELAAYREQPVSGSRAREVASAIGAVGYVECSALTRRNLKDVFDTALIEGLKCKNVMAGEEKEKNNKGWKRLWCFS